MTLPRYVKTPWPEDNVPIGEPSWFYYEIDDAADAVTRSVWVYADGLVTRNSIEIEERSGKGCPSLIDCSLEQGFEGADLEKITPTEFQGAWERGIDTPFWHP
ncbi:MULTISPECIES: hypothetical protein [unclassified Caulobacter]|uniref:hypothetical protein n=1 Tax=unclassified Caulobacter TaxID=2648921 RepID=UPI000D3BE977|nr:MULTISPECIES: hypothetical protein [unclassified Caulobacter]PTS88018.1 hypothetical protein DBR21_10750 [Caulobacter sp. HMWF009]PTT07109.1 hypothetical protein DBR10_10830 [Caulobacter sp. HMWF025]